MSVIKITNKQDLASWLEEFDIHIPIEMIPLVEPFSKPVRNSKWEEIFHDFLEDEYYFKEKSQPYFGIERCVVFAKKSDKVVEFYLVRPCPNFTKYGKIKTRQVSLDKEVKIFSNKAYYKKYVLSLFDEFDFTTERNNH